MAPLRGSTPCSLVRGINLPAARVPVLDSPPMSNELHGVITSGGGCKGTIQTGDCCAGTISHGGDLKGIMITGNELRGIIVLGGD